MPAGESPDTQPVPAEHAAAEAKDPDLEALFGPPEPDFSEQQPLTLIQVMQQALASKSPAFKLDGDAEEGRGERACLERARQMVTPIRHFIRFTRCEEALLSVATIEDCSAGFAIVLRPPVYSHYIPVPSPRSPTTLSRIRRGCRPQTFGMSANTYSPLHGATHS